MEVFIGQVYGITALVFATLWIWWLAIHYTVSRKRWALTGERISDYKKREYFNWGGIEPADRYGDPNYFPYYFLGTLLVCFWPIVLVGVVMYFMLSIPTNWIANLIYYRWFHEPDCGFDKGV